MNKNTKKIIGIIVALITLISAIIGLTSAIIDFLPTSPTKVDGGSVHINGDVTSFTVVMNPSEASELTVEGQNGIDVSKKKIDDIDESFLESEADIFKLIKVNFRLGDYEEVVKLAEENDIEDTEYMLNVLGVMYAQGLYYEKDYDKAIQYFTAATDYGTMDSSFLNLWLASYEKDRSELADTTFPYKNVCNAVKIGEKNGNDRINRILVIGIYKYIGEKRENGYSFINNLPSNELKLFFDSFYEEIGTYRYIVCTEYDYYADINGDVISNVTAYARCLEERTIPLYIYVGGSPAKYSVLDDIEIVPTSDQEPIITGTFEYETSYIDENGDTCFWIDTDNFFYGDTPPSDTENSRWVIQGFDENRNYERKYRQQVKQ